MSLYSYAKVSSYKLRQPPGSSLFRLARKVGLVAIASYNDKYCMMLLYLFGHKEGQVRHVPKENLECSLAS